MTALLTRLRIAGFKSFAEPTALDILPGLTGIVGPNGCGKSNVVEALRWAMGESSARSLRGGDMDDVIFAGTAARSSRNLAEVTITLQRPDGGALPDPFAAEDELQVTRRIERGAGSQYRANGRDMRARDVQTLFADMASGAKSSAMVSQGRVSALVNARPEDRRAVLEEAAGITGLHARRHEAELKLRAADANLTRAEELRTQLDTGREGLRKQARQAARYRNMSALVRGAETDFLAVLHARAVLAAQSAESAQAQAQAALAAAEAAVQSAAAEHAAAEAALPAPRDAEAAARSLLERRRLEAETLSAEAERAARIRDDAAARLALIEADLADAAGLERDADAAVSRLAGEAAVLRDRLAALPADIAAAEAESAAESAAARTAESVAQDAATQAAEAAAASRQAGLALAQAQARAQEAAHALAQAQAADAAARAALIDPAALADAAAAARLAADEVQAARGELALADAARDRCVAAAAEAKAVLVQATDRAAQADRALRDTAQRHARLTEALAAITRDLAAAERALVPEAKLDAARTEAGSAQQDADAAEQHAAAAEQSQGAAGTARLAALTARDQARADQTRLAALRDDAAAKAARLDREHATLAAALAAAEQAQPAPALLDDARAALAAAEHEAADAATALARFAEDRAQAAQALELARHAASQRAAELARLAAEADGVRQALGSADGPDAAPLLDEMEVPAGLEAALGAVLADAPATLDAAASRFWRDLGALPPAPSPAGCATLDAVVRGPAALARALSHAAIVADAQTGQALQAGLAPGWVLVSRQGDLWRWDGQVSRAGAPNAAATRLRLRARLRDLAGATDAAAADNTLAQDVATRAAAAAAAAADREAAARAAVAATEAARADRRTSLAGLQAAAEAAAAKLDSLRPAWDALEADRIRAMRALGDAADAVAALPETGRAEAELQSATLRAEEARTALAAARAAREARRAALTHATAALQTLEAAASRAESQVAALRPQQARLLAEHAEAQAAHEAAVAASAALPDLAALGREGEAAAAAEQGALAGLGKAQRDVAQAAERHSAAEAQLAALDRARAEAELGAASSGRVLMAAEAAWAREEAALAASQAALAALPDAAAMASAASLARLAVSEARGRETAAAEKLASRLGAQGDIAWRLPALEAELAAWQARYEEAARRHSALGGRAAAARDECAALGQEPLLLAARAAESGARLAAAAARHQADEAALRAAEDRLREAARAQREADADQASCREAVARHEGGATGAQAGLRSVLERAVERLGPEAELPEIALPVAADPARTGEAEEERARRKLDRLQRERDEMGPVNLRADLELDEVETRIAAIDAEREELTTAIAKLRGGIGHLNREGRARLAAVFEQVDAHFRTLFTRMMGGGRAHLALTGSDDPLEAGLEIYAEPPGKKLSALSLLSGGEQALTALSLIFAVFRCTPAPVAVLDEVDAPLDDVNVDRFCGLLEDVVRDTGTRFLVVTHHQLTMSRMDRLFGVTMQERGVSRLLSVDLRRAAEMVEPVMQAAE